MVYSGRKTLGKRRRVAACTFGVLLVVSLALFTVGLVFILKKKCTEQSRDTSTSAVDLCKHSEEAIKSGLIDLLANVRKDFKKNCPCRGFTGKNALVPAREYLKPSNIKDVTDKARKRLKQFKSLSIDKTKLTPRELKSLAKLEQFLSHNFGTPEDDYYSGSWLLGPNIMCNSGYMCIWFKHHVRYTVRATFQPKSQQDVMKIRKAFTYYNKTVQQYIDNLRDGVKRGMMRSTEACVAGLDALKSQFTKVAELSAAGILQERFAKILFKPSYYERLSNEMKEEWLYRYGKSVNESIQQFLVEYIGKPLEKLLWFLEHEHMLYCVPSRVSSGLSYLPLVYVYYNGTIIGKTVPFLPTGERLNGLNTYKKMLAFYTTTNLTADEIHALGWKHVNLLYSQILKLAKNVTGKSNESEAINNFKTLLNDRSQYYNKEPFPKNESHAQAKKNCLSIANAKKFCPKRWEAMQTWFGEEAKLLSQLDPKTHNLFHFTGSKRTTPNCPIELLPSFMPLAAQSYRDSLTCTLPSQYYLPFFNDNYGPRYQSLTINAHEGRPGHHTQMQGYIENFLSTCPADNISWLDLETRYSVFSEGWGLYAEYPLVAEFTDAYENKPLSRYGMLKGQIWRALRLVVDSGLHYKGMKRDEALALFTKFMWDNSDVISKEITRYQSVPGQASSYKIGQLKLIELRNYAKKEIGEKFNNRDFHYKILRHGTVPLHYIEYQVKKYVTCKKNSTGCESSQAPATTKCADSNYFSFLSEFESDSYGLAYSDRYY